MLCQINFLRSFAETSVVIWDLTLRILLKKPSVYNLTFILPLHSSISFSPMTSYFFHLPFHRFIFQSYLSFTVLFISYSGSSRLLISFHHFSPSLPLFLSLPSLLHFTSSLLFFLYYSHCTFYYISSLNHLN